MMGYAYYRIAMTINIMVFIVLVMVLFNGTPVLTPVMIILLALLDDVPVMLIAFRQCQSELAPVQVGHAKSAGRQFGAGVGRRGAELRPFHVSAHETEPRRVGRSRQRCSCSSSSPATCCSSPRGRAAFSSAPFPESRFFWAIIGTQVFAAFMAANGWLVTPIRGASSA